MPEKSFSIDALKGILAILVVGGHVAGVWHVNGLPMWMGSGFRMPLMVGISGYLLNLDRVRNAAIGDLAGRYWQRMLLPWMVAMILYLALNHRLTPTAPMDIILRPAFHLWYIPVLVAMILLARVVRLAPLVLLLIAFPVSFVTLSTFNAGHGLMGYGIFAVDSRFLSYLVFFFFGMMMARVQPHRLANQAALLVAGAGAAWWASLYQFADPAARPAALMMMNLGLIALLPTFSLVRFDSPVLVKIGRGSLFFYLWHPLPVAIATVHDIPPLATFAITVAILMIAFDLLARVPRLGAWFGVPRPHAGGTNVNQTPRVSGGELAV